MRKGFVLSVALALFTFWLAVPFTAKAAESEGVGLAEVATVPAPIKVKIEWQKEPPPAPSPEQLLLMEECVDRVNLSIPRKGVSKREAVAPPPLTGPSYAEDPLFEPQLPEDFTFVFNEQLTAAEAVSTSNIMEPTVAAVQMKKIFMTGNWFASRSQDHGQTWTHIDPYTIFPPGTDYIFCCDQEIYFDTRYNVFFWSMLYLSTTNTGGFWRLAVSRNLDTWWYYDFSKEGAAADDTLPDFPHLAMTDNYLYVTWNEFIGGFFDHVFVARFPKIHLSRGMAFGYGLFTRDDVFTIRVAHNHEHGSTMYAVTNWIFGASPWNQVRVFEMPEWSNSYVWRDKIVNSWNTWDFVCTDPGGNNPCGRLDDRVLGAVAVRNNSFVEDAKDQLWISWTAGRDASYDYPYTYIVRLAIHGAGSLSDWDVAAYSHIYNSLHAFIYTALYPNPRGDIGVTTDFIGGSWYNLFCATIIDQYNGYNPGWIVYSAGSGTSGPTNNSWGDYNHVVTWWRNALQFAGSGHVRTGGRSTPIYIRFARERDL